VLLDGVGTGAGFVILGPDIKLGPEWIQDLAAR
jgi:hypothetical protein